MYQARTYTCEWLVRVLLLLCFAIPACVATYYVLSVLLNIRRSFPIGYLAYTVWIVVVFELLYLDTSSNAVESMRMNRDYAVSASYLGLFVVGTVSVYCIIEHFLNLISTIT